MNTETQMFPAHGVFPRPVLAASGGFSAIFDLREGHLESARAANSLYLCR